MQNKNIFNPVLKGISRLMSPAHNITSNNVVGGALRGGRNILGAMGVNKILNASIGKRKIPIVPGVPMTSGKRGIDANHLNSSGVGLAMHKNRRKF